MPDYPVAALSVAREAIRAEYPMIGDVMCSKLATLVLDATAPLFGHAVAAKITEHAERQHPRDPAHVPTAWDRHFSIAARIAGGAFSTEAELRRQAAEALAAGNYAACRLDDAGRPVRDERPWATALAKLADGMSELAAAEARVLRAAGGESDDGRGTA